ncbi:hypothetical protein [Herbidospora mongoliensis]|uniref:hypothetical protein n=1 Tax=Herbidospora mongoliensis TaxID=688067 RepID=UPI0012FAB774|nr:hypothetical protein [Herbidospora mongoliensis]
MTFPLPGPGHAGDAARARDQYAAQLPIRERVLGAGHPGTLTARAQPRLLGPSCGETSADSRSQDGS